MKFGLLSISLLSFICVSCNSGENNEGKTEVKKPGPGKYSSAFNSSIDSLLSAYYAMTEAFVAWDSASIMTTGRKVDDRLKFLSADELKSNAEQSAKATLDLFRMQSSILDLTGFSDITTKRHRLHDFSEALFDYLETIRYDQKKIYLQECNMPFNDTGRGVWLSKSEERRNPYLGLYHPYYKSGMLECGTMEATIDYTSEAK